MNEDTTAPPVTGATPAPGATPEETTAAEPTPATDAGSPEQTAAEAPLGDVGQRLLAEARKAQRDAERRAKEVEKLLREREEADLSETQRMSKRLAELEAEQAAWQTERQQVYVGLAVRDLQPKYGLIDPEAVTRLMDWSLIDFDEKHRPTNVEDAVRVLLRDKPYLGGVRPQAAPVTTNATEGTTGARLPNLTADELEAAKVMGMTAERYAALKGVKTIEDWQATRRTQGQS